MLRPISVRCKDSTNGAALLRGLQECGLSLRAARIILDGLPFALFAKAGSLPNHKMIDDLDFHATTSSQKSAA